MSDYIKRDDALNIDFKIIVRAFENRKTTATNAVQAYAEEIAKIPSEDVRPVVRGRWDDKPVAFFLKCSKCGCCVGHRYDVFLDRGELNYCPNCGADMREES